MCSLTKLLLSKVLVAGCKNKVESFLCMEKRWISLIWIKQSFNKTIPIHTSSGIIDKHLTLASPLTNRLINCSDTNKQQRTFFFWQIFYGDGIRQRWVQPLLFRTFFSTRNKLVVFVLKIFTSCLLFLLSCIVCSSSLLA